jgi:hypothetical protein
VEVIKEEQGQPVDRMGGCTGQEVFDQGAAIFTEVDGVHARHRWVVFNQESHGLAIKRLIITTSQVASQRGVPN